MVGSSRDSYERNETVVEPGDVEDTHELIDRLLTTIGGEVGRNVTAEGGSGFAAISHNDRYFAWGWIYQI